MTNDHDRRHLLELARSAIRRHLRQEAPAPADVILLLRAGAFVTIMVDGELHGCIGHTEANEPLSVLIPQCAVAAATDDPRFRPLTVEELDRAEIEISVLGPVELVVDINEIEVGRHGLMVEQGRWRGLLLPQVATERAWDRETFLSNTCIKAGLHREAWRTGARIFRFDAEVFGEPSETGSGDIEGGTGKAERRMRNAGRPKSEV